MTIYTFRGYTGRAQLRFTCPSCQKPNRVRTFTEEHTVNPFNKNEDGSVRTASEVRDSATAAARKKRDEFARKPLCASCENGLTLSGQSALRADRRQTQP